MRQFHALFIIPLIGLLAADASAAPWNREAVYTSRVAELQQAIADHPNEAQPLVDLAKFYLKPVALREVEAADGKVRTFLVPLRNERTRPIKEIYCVPWVFRGDPDLARPLLNRALRIDPKSTAAMREMAMFYRMKSDLDSMKPFLEAAIAKDPSDLELCRLYLDHRTAVALNMNEQAASLRTPRVWDEERADGKYRMTQQPSKADLARATQLDEQSQEVRREGIKALETLATSLKDDPTLKTDAAKRSKWRLATAIYAHWLGDLSNAAGTAMAALREDPTNLDALDFIVDLLRGTHTNDKLKEYKSILDRWGNADSQPEIVRENPQTFKKSFRN
jgi:hypothetical protein